MAYEAYQQVARPVSRIAEKILGWLSWVLLLLTTIVAMFFGLVLFSNESSIQNIENGIANNPTMQTFLANNNLTATQFVISMQNGVWAFIVYLIVCLLISFLALISMKHRIVSGLLFLLVAILSIPLFFILVPLFFVIVAFMMFIRKDKMVSVPGYYYEGNQVGYERNYGQSQPYNTSDEKVYRRPSEQEPRNNDNHESKVNQPTATSHNDEAKASESPQVLSRTAKYHHKSVRNQEDVPSNDLTDEDDTVVYQPRSEAQKEDNHVFDSRTHVSAKDVNGEDEPIDQETLKQQRKDERAQIKAQKKEDRKARKAQVKEQRKARPSAATQRRQNYDYRKQVQKERSTDTQDTEK
ncbi:DUF4064 domain-containing protein [Staphylococcus agnetis]|uniref:lipoteichoic acid stability factor AuxB n=1 Tax=Staphylococcus agnetis TaxID=985762 RepID=UPI0021D00AC7|nr:DUF4064 domain-containing protein [Staphylococcus agnetis]UXU54335.1 DUF4064 domain-containing protein [Staphylococcus agnetis]